MIFTQIRSFHAVATEGGFTAAAKALNVGQPTITSQVKGLEQRYNVELFVRRGKRVELTSAGQELLALASKMIALEGDARDLLRGLGGLCRGTLKIGAVGPYHAMEILNLFHHLYPHVALNITTGNSDSILHQLINFDVDVAILAHTHKDGRVISIPYGRHQVVAFVHTSHPWSNKKSVPIRDFDRQPMILREVGSTTRRAFENALQEAAVTVDPVMELGSRESVWMAVTRGLGIAVVSEAELIPHPDVRMVRICDAKVETFAHVAYLAERKHSLTIQAFIDVVNNVKKSAKK